MNSYWRSDHTDTWTDQAPVSDREFRATLPETAGMIDLASKLISEGRGSELMPRDANQDSPITAYRWEFKTHFYFRIQTGLNTHIWGVFIYNIFPVDLD